MKRMLTIESVIELLLVTELSIEFFIRVYTNEAPLSGGSGGGCNNSTERFVSNLFRRFHSTNDISKVGFLIRIHVALRVCHSLIKFFQ